MVTAVAGMGCIRAYVLCFILSVLVRWAGVWEVRAASITGGSVPRGPHISNLNVLLPPRSSRPVHYHLQGYNGCFTWTWDHHDLLNVEAEYNGTNKDCSTSAVLTSLAPFTGRKTTAVHAKDSLTGQILRCEVFIDKIFRIQIFHHSLKLDLDGMATLRIRAFDTEDNVFSSLAGLQFMWQLSPLSQTGDVAHRLTHVPLKHTSLIDGEIETQIELEQNGLGSDLYVVRGTSAGQERVAAHFMEPGFENLSHIITLTVAEAVSLDPPSPVYIIPGTQLQFTLRALRRNEVKVITLPSKHHRWSLDNFTVADIDPLSGLITAHTYGSTVVTVVDLRLTGHEQTSTIHVVNPISLALYLSPLPVKGTGALASRHQPLVTSDSPWQVVTGRKYVVQALSFSRESGTQPLLLTKDNELTMPSANLPYWKVFKVPDDVVAEQGWRNCSLLEAMAEGSGKLMAALGYGVLVQDMSTGRWLQTNKEVLVAEQEIMVCTEVKIVNIGDSGSLRLPWASGQEQEYQLLAEGGCGEKLTDYKWSSSDPAVATVNSVGVVQSKGLGRATIYVVAVGDAFNDAEVSLEVSYPSMIDIVPGLPVEAEVGSYIPVAVGLRDPSGLEYSRCDVFRQVVRWGVFGADGLFSVVTEVPNILYPELQSRVGDKDAESFHSEQKELLDLIHPHACAWTLISAAQPGRGTVRASLNMRDLLVGVSSPEIEGPYLECSWAIAAFSPLTLEQAGDGGQHGGYSHKVAGAGRVSVKPSESERLRELLLVPRSNMKVILLGGPERWRQGVEFIDTHDIITDHGSNIKDDVGVSHAQDGGNRIYNIECKTAGNYTVNFYRGNLVGEDHPTKSVATTSLSVICAVPSAIVLLIDEPENGLYQIKSAAHAERDANHQHITPVTVINNRSIRVAAVALHELGRPFANASSLGLLWKLDGCIGLAHWEVEPQNAHVDVGGWERYLALKNVVGECTVYAGLHGFVGDSVSTAAVFTTWKPLERPKDRLSDAVQLQLVAALRIEPNNILLFHHPNAKASLAVLGGTADIQAHANDSTVVGVVPLDTHELMVNARGSGTSLITIRDVGLATPASANALVTVADVAGVRMLLSDDTSLQVGACMTVQTQAVNSFGRAFDSSQFGFMNLKVLLKDEVLTATANRVDMAANEFVICGVAVGLTSTLHVSVTQHNGKEVFSDFAQVSVYAPLSIHPSELVLAPGAKYMLGVDGGPQTGFAIQFDAINSEFVKIDPTSGLLEAKAPGQTTIRAQARSHGGEVLSQAETNITVQVPVSMKLNVKGGQLAIGREVTIFPYGLEENLFAFFDLCSNYKWSIEKDQVLALRGLDGSIANEIETTSPKLEKSRGKIQKGVDGLAGTPHGFSARAVGMSAGKTTVTLSFTCRFFYHGRTDEKEYKPSGTIWVYPDPPLALGMGATWVLPPVYTSSPLLPQWKKHAPALLDFGRSGRNVVYSVMHEGVNDGNIMSIMEGGVIRTFEKTEVGCIHARDLNTGRSEIAACVRVAEVASITVGDGHVTELSVGTDQRIVVTLRDDLGAPFLEAGDAIPILLDTNRADVVSIKVADYERVGSSTKVTIGLWAMRQGTALICISYKGKPHIVDWVLVNVGAHVTPRNPVAHIGNHFSFSIVGKGLHGLPAGERGSWCSSNGDVVQVNSYTGEAQAIGEGTATVSFNGSRLTTYTTVTVIRVASIHVEAPTGIMTNVPIPLHGYAFPLQFRDSIGRDVGIVGENREVSYSCRVGPSFIGEAKVWREPGTSEFQCVFLPYQPIKVKELHRKWVLQNTKQLREFNGKLEFTLTATSAGVEGSATAWFAGGFEVIDTLPSELQFSPKSKDWTFSMIGFVHQDIVQPTVAARPDAFEFRLQNPKSETAGVAGRATYKMKLLEEDKPFTDTLVIKSSITGQRLELPIIYKAGKSSVATFSAQIVMAVILILILLILPLIFCARILDLPRTNLSQRTLDSTPLEEPAGNNSLETTPDRQRRLAISPRTPLSRTPLSRTPPSKGFESRTTPQQALKEHTLRTLDSTPFCGRGDEPESYFCSHLGSY